MSVIDFAEQLANDEVDVGDSCAVEPAVIEDDTLPETKKKVITAICGFVLNFFHQEARFVAVAIHESFEIA